MIRRTNPWIGGGCSNGDAPPPRSPDQTTPPAPPMPVRCLRWSAADETGKEATPDTTTGTTEILGNSVVKFVDEESNVFFSPSIVYSGDDSLLTTSRDTDSLFQSEISDNESTRSSHLDRLDLAPNDNERRTCDEVSLSADSLVENFDVSGSSRSGLSSPSLCFGRHKDPATDRQGDRPSTEAVNSEREKNRKRLRRNPESNISDWKKKKKQPPSSVDETGQISELFPSCKAQATAERRRSNDVRTKTTTAPDEILRDDDSLTDSDQLRREILTIRSSLQDKVALLKHEKRVVDRKIREAREEERLRLRQLEIFRQQLSHTRKEILLRTLEEVKKQLNLQVLRLQNVYDFVLVEQRQLVCCY